METDRRQFLRGMVTTVAGVALFGEGVAYLVADGLKERRIPAKARREVMDQGKTPPDQEVLKKAQKLSQELTQNPPTERSPEEIRQVREILEQQANFDEAVQKNKDQRLREEGITPSSYGFNLARAVGGVAVTLIGIEEMQEDVARNREATEQNKQR